MLHKIILAYWEAAAIVLRGYQGEEEVLRCDDLDDLAGCAMPGFALLLGCDLAVLL